MFQAVHPLIIISSKTLYTASGTCQNFTAVCRYRARDRTGLRVLCTRKPVPTVYTVFELLMMGRETA
jgi:hypothetical protein